MSAVEAGSVTFELNGPGIPAGTIQASASTESTVVLISWLSPALIPVSSRVSPKTTAAHRHGDAELPAAELEVPQRDRQHGRILMPSSAATVSGAFLQHRAGCRAAGLTQPRELLPVHQPDTLDRRDDERDRRRRVQRQRYRRCQG